MKLQQLTEATFDTDEAVNFIYNTAFKSFIEDLREYARGGAIDQPYLDTFTFNESLLRGIRDPKFREAYAQVPVTINTGPFKDGSWYRPNTSVIQISFNDDVYGLLRAYIASGKSFERLLNDLPESQRLNFMQEVTGEVVKGSIAHEISHWMSDTFHNQHLGKMISKAHEAPNIILRGKKAVVATDYEIDAQIHGIKQYRRRFTQEEWDSFTFEKLFNLYPGLNTVRRKLQQTGEFKQWFRQFAKRLYREGLLGKNMVTM